MATLTITVGLPGSGKTTWARQRAGAVRVNRDDLRAALNGPWPHGDQAMEDVITGIQLHAIGAWLRAGRDVIADDTNLSATAVALLANLGRECGAEVAIEDFTHVPVEVCVKRDAGRPEPVGEARIREMWAGYLADHIVTGDEARALMAPYLGSAQVAGELDSPCVDKSGKVWLVSTIGGQVAGWSAAMPGPDEVVLETSYVLPSHRRRGVYRALFAARMDRFGGRRLVGWAADESLPEYLRCGFTAVTDGWSETGHHWTEVRLEP